MIHPDLEQFKTAHIIGGGVSATKAKDYTLRKTGFTIGVNDSYFYHDCHMVVSIDGGGFMLHRTPKLREQNAYAWFRRDTFVKHVGLQNAWENLLLADVSVSEDPLGADLTHVVANNSGLAGAIVAARMGFRRIFLYGMDLALAPDGKKHWYKEYEWKQKGNNMYPFFLQHWEIASVKLNEMGIEVINVNPNDTLPFFKRIDYDELSQWID